MRKLFYLVIVMGLALSGCMMKPVLRKPATTINYPGNNEVATANIGDTIVKKAKIYEIDGIEIITKADVDSFGGLRIVAYPGFKMLVGQTETLKLYSLSPTDVGSQNTGYRCYLAIKKEDASIGYTVSDEFGVRGFSKLDIVPTYEYASRIAQDSPSFVQELIYNGRSGNFLKFLYRELSGGYMRNAFNQESQYDLDDGNIIGFKEVRIEVIEASNTNIKYKVLDTFD